MIPLGQKIDKEKMWELIKAGKNDVEIAKVFGCKKQAVFAQRKKLNVSIVKVSSLETAHRIVEKELDVVTQLNKINKHTNTILSDLLAKINKKQTKTLDIEGVKDLRGLALDAIKENRMQLSFQMEIFKTLADYKVMQDFQREVLDTVGNANKCPKCGKDLNCEACGAEIDLRAALIGKLKASKALRASVELTR